jgi:hypothetical protein
VLLITRSATLASFVATPVWSRMRCSGLRCTLLCRDTDVVPTASVTMAPNDAPHTRLWGVGLVLLSRELREALYKNASLSINALFSL